MSSRRKEGSGGWRSGGGQSPERIAEAVRTACLEAARRAYEEAGTSGLCAEGRWELAQDAIRSLDLETLFAELDRDHHL